MERLKEDKTDMWLSMISLIDSVVTVYKGLTCELSKSLNILCNVFADKGYVVRGINCRTYSIFVVNNEHGFCNIRIFEYRCCFCVDWSFKVSDSNLNQWPNSFNLFWNVVNLKQIYDVGYFPVWWYPNINLF